MNRKLLFLPLILILGLCLLLVAGLQKDPKKLASALIGKPVPEFHLPTVQEANRIVNNTSLPKEIHLLNVWGSWCGYCKDEMPFLTELAKEIKIIGLDYRDKPQSAVDFLKKFGNPYWLNIDDSKGQLAMQLGVDGAPETYLIDRHGVIRYRYSGAINREIWRKEFQPLMTELNAQ
ncbi:cytochrome c biogenesis protein CcmG/thiol:disulfide interchange protein DsbE [Cricetibacter osteomyelitidis]|uniref:Cytochrome c biogenesis protein CcmG/thiol:disulfide interchange protein DsbE n=1 Tax=Cricetibacter osteomyelitidis TaxID=1521931 RepID=A0A4R2T0F1_9PAST|nr:DsbE family thiol:disulfide interchange protein [Cricetibacter osteomyelitidis]TCP95540.1 cytochrome c biogenesis protein CcmG/thiol:disulfide interchange protein DsbE [Cricetibacter osteomyelitidis]